MNRRITVLIALSLSLCFSSFVSLVANEKSSADSSLFPSKILDNKGKSVSSDVLDGKIVGIYFSAQWCPPCRHFTPSLVEFRNKNSKDFEVVFVSSDRSSEDQLKYMEKYGMKWYTLPHGSDAAKQLSKKYEVRGIPALVIVDADGNTITKNGRGDVSKDPSGALASWQKKS
ncbi:MAG: thioredoxin family protein [Verrucomicrobia bacterium]|jgi:nucleoredoxin|nr:thioredoxin family protein [Verrucomicrobiota bacterium]MDA0905836.1 thioredoxin family protein [Verrucomicrobiota bacterium]